MLFLCSRTIRCHVLHKVGHGVAFHRHGRGVPRRSGSGGRVDPRSVVHKIGRKRRILHLRILQIPRQLVDDRADHFQMPQFIISTMIDMAATQYPERAGERSDLELKLQLQWLWVSEPAVIRFFWFSVVVDSFDALL